MIEDAEGPGPYEDDEVKVKDLSDGATNIFNQYIAGDDAPTSDDIRRMIAVKATSHVFSGSRYNPQWREVAPILQGFYEFLDRAAHDEETMQKVYDAMVEKGLSEDFATEIVSGMQNKGILFRERG